MPNAVTPAHFADLREHWDDGQIVEILAVVGLFGFLNRWNDTMATDLEDTPAALADRTIGPHGWEPGSTDDVGEQITLEELERDPYPIYARLRDEEAVSWVPAVQLWLVTRYEDVRTSTSRRSCSPRPPTPRR